jgi:thiazole synthase
MQIILNGDPHEVAGPLTLTALLTQLHIDPRRVAVEHNLTVIKRANYDSTQIQDGDQIEIVNFVGGGSLNSDPLVIAGREFASRLIVGTGKYSSFQVMQRAHEASGADMVTVAVRRVELGDRTLQGTGAPGSGKESLLDYIDTNKIALLPNTAGCYSADDAVRTARLGREAGLSNWVKLEVIGDERTLFPDNEELLVATKILVKEGFVVLPYTTDDPIACRKLQDAGAAAVMPLGAPIGSGLGIQNANNIRIIREFSRVPIILDAGVGTASDATIAMELGADGVLMNTAIAEAQDPIAMATAMRLAVQAGRLAYRAGRMSRRMYASASSPLAGTLK